MKSIIRWPGLVAFTVIIGLIATISIVFMDFWIKLAAEKGLANATGAEVNIASVEHSFSPFGVILHQIELTDPKKPATNQMQAATVSAKIELAPLLLRKLIIDDLVVEQAQFGTLRDSEGDVYIDVKQQGKAIEDIFGDAVTPPSIDELLEKSPLKTTQAIQDTQQLYAKHSEQLKQQYENLPTKEQLTEYKKTAKELSETDYKDPAQLIVAKEKFEQLKQAVLADKAKLNDFKQAVSQAKNEVGPQLVKLKNAPQQDYQQLKALAAGDQDAIQDVTQLVFGEQAAQWSKYVLAAFDILAPMLKSTGQQEQKNQGVKGQWIGFDDTSSLPDLWIKNADISLSWQTEEIQSTWTDITHQHDVLGKPTLFSINSSASKLWQSLKLNGNLWLAEAGAKAEQEWQLAGLKLSDLALIDSDKMSSQLEQGLLSSKGQLKLNGETLSGTGLIDLNALAISATGSNKLTNAIASTLNKMQQLQLNTDIGGTLGDLDLSVSSDLAQQIGSALISNASPEQQAKLDELKQKLNAKTSGLLSDSNTEMSQWLEWEKLVDGNLSSINDVLKTKLNSAIDKQKDRLKNKLLDKILN